MEFKGTKGEWIVNKGNNVVSKHNLPIAIVYDGYTAHGSYKNEDENDRKANAKLISCAPEMLEMLIYLNSFCSMKKEDRELLNQIISKATAI